MKAVKGWKDNYVQAKTQPFSTQKKWNQDWQGIWINKMLGMYTTEYYTSTKRNKLDILTVLGIDL